MPSDVVMPQMGESIAEGTIVRCIKRVGDQVARDEPLFEISTDKVDAEIPSPAAGVLAEIRVKEGETVPVNSVVAVIGQAGEPAAKAGEAPKDHQVDISQIRGTGIAGRVTKRDILDFIAEAGAPRSAGPEVSSPVPAPA